MATYYALIKARDNYYLKSLCDVKKANVLKDLWIRCADRKQLEIFNPIEFKLQRSSRSYIEGSFVEGSCEYVIRLFLFFCN